MKKSTKLITLIASVTLLTACGNNQKPSDDFTNEKEPKTEQTIQSTSKEETTETETSTEQTTESSSPKYVEDKLPDTTIVPEYYEDIPWDEFVKVYHPQLGGTYIPTIITTPLPNYGVFAIINTKNPTDAIIVYTSPNYTIAHLRMQEAKDFANWVNSVAQDKPLQHSLYENLQYYFNNVK